jgi:hypothetical protein
MITVTLTNPRHIAAATAAYAATIPADPEATPPYADVTAYVQARVNDMLDSWVETTKVDQISVGAFVLRFTGSEFAAIAAAAGSDANVAAILGTLRARDSVRLGSVDAINGIAYLVAAGLLTAERAEDVLRYDAPSTP